MSINLDAVFFMGQAVGRRMVARSRGKIINICSMGSELARPTITPYNTSKAAVKMLTQSMCAEWAKHNVQSNGIGPGYIATSQTAPIRVDGHPFNNLVMTRTPAGRWGQPEDLAGAALLLASRAGDYINGQIIYVDGGILANFGYVEGENRLPG